MSPQTHLCFDDQKQAPTLALNGPHFQADWPGFSMPRRLPLNHSSSYHHMPNISLGLFHSVTPEHGGSAPILQIRTNACVCTFIFHFPHFLGVAFSSEDLKSFYTGPFISHSAISGFILAQFSLQYTPNLLGAPQTHIKHAFASKLKKNQFLLPQTKS